MTFPHVPLRRLFRVINGGTPTAEASNWDGAVPWATPIDLGSAGLTFNLTARTLTERGLHSGSRLAPAGSILLSTRAPIGNLSICTVPMAFNQGCRALAPVGEASSRFHAYQLTARSEELQRAGQGSTFLELPSDALAAFPVTNPPGEEQRRIADFLDDQVARLNRALWLRTRQRELIEQSIGESLEALYTPVLHSGSTTTLRHLLRTNPCYGVLVPVFVDAGAPFCRVGVLPELENGQLPEVYISVAQSMEYRRTIVNPGDVLTSVVGSLGVSAIVPEVARGVNIARAVARLQPAENVTPWFLRGYLSTKGYLDSARLATGSGAAQPTLNMGDLVRFEVGGADDADEARDTGRRAETLIQQQREGRKALELSSRLLNERKQALITAAVTGQFDVTTARSVA